MSHFTVLVIGNNPEEQLQPYHEYECTGIKDKHVVFVEDEEYDYTHPITRKRGHWTNPNAKWDWYQLGGRWAGFFTVKKDAVFSIQGHHRAKDFDKSVEDLPKNKVDQLLKKDIDIDRMRLEERADAIVAYSKFITALDGEPMPPKWREFVDRYPDVQDARREYHKIKGVQNLNEFFGFDQYLTTEEKYVETRVNEVMTTHAVLKDGVWYERGEMGWWGVVHDEKVGDKWESEFRALFDSVPDDTLISVYDCHI